MRLSRRNAPTIILAICAFYFLVVLHQYTIGRTSEFFPLFSWSLFSYSPRSTDFLNKSFIVLERKQNDKVIEKIEYTVGNSGIRLQKNLRAAIRHCASHKGPACEEHARTLLTPFIDKTSLADQSNYQFYGVVCAVKVSDVTESLKNGAVKFPKSTQCMKSKVVGPFDLGI